MSQALIALVTIVLDEADKFAADDRLPDDLKEIAQKHAMRLQALYGAVCEESATEERRGITAEEFVDRLAATKIPEGVGLCVRCGRVPPQGPPGARVCNNCAAAGN